MYFASVFSDFDAKKTHIIFFICIYFLNLALSIKKYVSKINSKTTISIFALAKIII